MGRGRVDRAVGPPARTTKAHASGGAQCKQIPALKSRAAPAWCRSLALVALLIFESLRHLSLVTFRFANHQQTVTAPPYNRSLRGEPAQRACTPSAVRLAISACEKGRECQSVQLKPATGVQRNRRARARISRRPRTRRQPPTSFGPPPLLNPATTLDTLKSRPNHSENVRSKPGQ